ncbi:MAG: class I SAM-dependent methyltransferase [Solirubrobacteraceae bacterium]
MTPATDDAYPARPDRLLTAVPDRTAPARANGDPRPTPPVLADWDAQQAAYIADREGRFAVILDVLALTLGEMPVVVDLACGPGSLAVRILERFPGSRVVAVDVDPLLLRVAGEALAPFGDRATTLDADLTRGEWTDAVVDALGGDRPTAATSTTALHWLTPHELVAVYARTARLLAPGGVLLNGDHLRFDDRHPTLRRISAVHDEETQARGFAAGAPTWDAWWSRARALPGGDALAAERERRFAGRDAPPPTTLDFHVEALRQADFAEVAPVWQLLDDYVVFGRTPVL